MNNSKFKALLSAIKQSPAYKSKGIKVVQSNGRLLVNSINNSTEAFHETEIICLANAMSINNYLCYDKELDKVVLHLF